MKITKVTCPACNGNLSMDIEGRKTIFCPYCGTQMAIDNGEFVINQNINIHTTHTDEAAIELARLQEQKEQRDLRFLKQIIAGSSIFLIIILIMLLFMDRSQKNDEKNALHTGMIQVGISSAGMKGKKYTGIEEQLESQGFTRIICIDLDDASFFSKENTIASVTIDGDSSFRSSDYFDPDVKIVISYH